MRIAHSDPVRVDVARRNVDGDLDGAGNGHSQVDVAPLAVQSLTSVSAPFATP
jgi:hypothetical protein